MSNDNKLLFSNHMFPFVLSIFFIVTVIKSSIALSLGLVGALSIIRFRTAIKEPGQLIVLLVLTALGISIAAEKEPISILVTILYALHAFFNKRRTENTENTESFLRVVCSDTKDVVTLIDNKHFYRLYNDKNGKMVIEFSSSEKDRLSTLLSEINTDTKLESYEIF